LIAERNLHGNVSAPGTSRGQNYGEEFELGSTRAIAISPDGQILATGNLNAGIILQDALSGRQLGEPLSLHKGIIPGLAFGSQGNTLVSIGVDGQIILWNLAANSPAFGQPYGPPIDGPQLSPLPAISFSQDAYRLAVGRPDGTIHESIVTHPRRDPS
jgi:WD40 repeat protein